MTGFRSIGSTPFDKYSAGEVRAFARAVTGDGVAADARSVQAAGTAQAQSVAELERDVATQVSKWTGEDATAAFGEIQRFVTASYATVPETLRTVRQLNALSYVATTTNKRFSDIADPGIEMRDFNPFDRNNDSVGAKVAAELRSVYTSPVQTDASSMPLGTKPQTVTFSMGPGSGVTPGGTTSPGGTAPGGTAAPSGTDSTTGGTTDPGAGTATLDDDSALSAGTDGDGTAQQTGEQAGTGTSATPGAGTTSGETGGTGLPTGTDGTTGGTDTDPYDTGSGVTPLLSPAGSTTPYTATGRSTLGGSTGGRVGVGGTASPLGLRPDAAALRGTAPGISTGTPATTGARSSSMPFGGAPAAGAGQRGQGDGRHRTPAYLIDRANGEEIVGGMPLVGPGVIGEWRPDGAPEVVRRPEPPVRDEPRRS